MIYDHYYKIPPTSWKDYEEAWLAACKFKEICLRDELPPNLLLEGVAWNADYFYLAGQKESCLADLKEKLRPAQVLIRPKTYEEGYKEGIRDALLLRGEK